MKFQLYKYYGGDEGIYERDLQIFRIGNHWLFDFNFYKGRFKSYGLDLLFSPMVPMNDLFYTRLHLGKVAFGFGILQRHFDFDDWEDLTDLDTEIKP
jgi:hypothetical protein